MSLKALVGASLDGWKIVEMVEVFKVNDDGRYVGHVSLFYSPDIAEAFKQNQVDASYHSSKTMLVLTDGEVAYAVKDEAFEVPGDEAVRLEIIEKIKLKLSDAELKAIGFIATPNP